VEVQRFFFDNPLDFTIQPQKGARVEEYNPYNKYPQIILDYIDLIKLFDNSEVNNKEIQKKQAKYYLSFAHKYGLLGSMFSGVVDIQPGKHGLLIYMSHCPGGLPYEISLQIKGNKSTGNIIKYKDYARYFFDEELDPYPYPYTKSFFEKYSESILFTKSRSSITRLLPNIRRIFSEFEDNVYQSPNNEITLPDFYKVSLIQDDNNNYRIEFKFKSLIEALNIMYIRNIMSSGQRVKSCDECGFTFIVGKDGRKRNSRFCSSSCGNRYRVRKHRNKKTSRN